MRNSTIILLFVCSTIPSTLVNLYLTIVFSTEVPSISNVLQKRDAVNNNENRFAPPSAWSDSTNTPRTDTISQNSATANRSLKNVTMMDTGAAAAAAASASDTTEISSPTDITISTTNSASTANIMTYNKTTTTTDVIFSKMQLTSSRARLEEVIPSWMVEYFDWHRQQRQRLNRTNWKSRSHHHHHHDDNNFRFLILRCSKRDRACGGVSDRLKPLPFYLRLAYETQRIFLIRWEQPYPLEAFLQPTEHFNWSVPAYIESRLNSQNRHQSLINKPNIHAYDKGDIENLFQLARAKRPIIVESKRQRYDGGEEFYTNLTNGIETYKDVYHGTFRVVFQPAPAVAALVVGQLEEMGLVPGEYSAAHVRNFYSRRMRAVSKTTLSENAINAVNCASQLHPGDPIYFASDSTKSVEAVQEYATRSNNGNTSKNLPIHTITDQSDSRGAGDPLHLDFAGRGNKTWPVEAFYDTFVDLLVLGNARCISYGEGGYGTFANLLSFDPNCTSTHTVRVSLKDSVRTPCEWKQ